MNWLMKMKKDTRTIIIGKQYNYIKVKYNKLDKDDYHDFGYKEMNNLNDKSKNRNRFRNI